MKIGILTFHRSQNYGAQLQAYALRKYIESLGHDSFIIDYWPDYRKERYRLFSKEEFSKLSFVGKVIYFYNKIFTCIRFNIRNGATEKFANKYLNIRNTTEVDVAVYGSDQIWRKFNRTVFKNYDPVFFGEGLVSAKRKISYAASMGQVVFKSIEDKSFFYAGMRNFDAISVRETDLQQCLLEEFNIPASKVCDPTLLLTPEQWMEIVDGSFIPPYDYILYYRLQPLAYADKFVKRLAKEKKLRVIEMRGVIPAFHYSRRYRLTANAQEFFSLLQGAKYVVSSSFHGVALSIVMSKQFFFISSDKSANRAMSLLSDLCLQGRRVVNPLEHDVQAIIDYSPVQDRMKMLIDSSQKWLRTNLLIHD